MDPVIDFQVIETNDPKRLIVHDFSDWVDSVTYVTTIEITLPGQTDPVNITYGQNLYNAYDSINLLSETVRTDLPDGIYTLNVIGIENSTFNLEKKYLKTDVTEISISKLYLQEYNKCTACDPVKVLRELRYCLEAAKELIKIGELEKAQATFNRVISEVDRQLNCEDCK